MPPKLSNDQHFPDNGRTLIVGAIRGEVDNEFPIYSRVLAPHGNAGDRLFATTTISAPSCYTPAEWRRLVADARERDLAFDHETPIPSISGLSSAGLVIPVHSKLTFQADFALRLIRFRSTRARQHGG